MNQNTYENTIAALNQTEKSNSTENSTDKVAFKEATLALSIKHALNESAQTLPQATLDKLYAARRKAVTARNAASNQVNPIQSFLRGIQGVVASFGTPLAFAAPALVVGVGLYIMSTGNADNYVQTVAEIDTQVLTQELPINALLDKGFVRYVQVGE
jgi:Protein of unknown function (DUF3619)